MPEGFVPQEVIEAAQKHESEKNDESSSSERSPEQESRSIMERIRTAHETLMDELIRPVKEKARQAKEALSNDRSLENFNALVEAQRESGFTALSKAELNQIAEFLTYYILEIDPAYKSQYQALLAALQDAIDQTKSDNE